MYFKTCHLSHRFVKGSCDVHTDITSQYTNYSVLLHMLIQARQMHFGFSHHQHLCILLEWIHDNIYGQFKCRYKITTRHSYLTIKTGMNIKSWTPSGSTLNVKCLVASKNIQNISHKNINNLKILQKNMKDYIFN